VAIVVAAVSAEYYLVPIILSGDYDRYEQTRFRLLDEASPALTTACRRRGPEVATSISMCLCVSSKTKAPKYIPPSLPSLFAHIYEGAFLVDDQ
jgi:hypothetical protein